MIRAVALVYSIAVATQILAWFVLYRFAGYNARTLATAQILTLVLAVIFLAVYRLRWREVGLSLRRFVEAVAAILVAYAAVLVLVLVVRGFGGEVPLFRSSYSAFAFVDNWMLTGFAEELLFAGVIFNLLRAGTGENAIQGGAGSTPTRPTWQGIRQPARLVLIVALLFSLWHLPGYIAVALRTGGVGPGILGNLLLNAASWCFFGAIYAFSGNLWLVAFAHASTDYALLPTIVGQPLIGLFFMALVVLFSLYYRRRSPE